MSKELETLEEKLHDLSYVLSREEISELRSLCYEHSNSWCPLSDFFNDICLIKSETYNKNQAFKDLWLIALIVLDKKKALKDLEYLQEKTKGQENTIKMLMQENHKMKNDVKALEIIKEKQVDVGALLELDLELYNKYAIEINGTPTLTQEEFDLLKEALL